MVVTVTRAELVAKLRSLLAGERTEAATVEAERLLAELGDEGEQKRPPTRAARPAVDDEAARWRRVIAMRRGGMGSAVVWDPARDVQRRAARGPESAWTRENEQKTYLRNWSPWR